MSTWSTANPLSTATGALISPAFSPCTACITPGRPCCLRERTCASPPSHFLPDLIEAMNAFASSSLLKNFELTVHSRAISWYTAFTSAASEVTSLVKRALSASRRLASVNWTISSLISGNSASPISRASSAIRRVPIRRSRTGV